MDSQLAGSFLRRQHALASGIPVVDGFLNGHEIPNAILDTGATYNIMAASLARKLNLDIQPHTDINSSRAIFLVMANHKHLKTVGTVRTVWRFLTDRDKAWDVVFMVIEEDCICSLVLGGHFLLCTQSRSIPHGGHGDHHIHPLLERTNNISGPTISGSLCVAGLLGGRHPVYAMADSGCESNLVSLELASSPGWLSCLDPEDRRFLQFPDGSVQRTEGSIVVDWIFAKSRAADHDAVNGGVSVKLHVLRGCTPPLILGRDFLEGTDAFVRHSSSFFFTSNSVDVDIPISWFNLVVWAPKKEKKAGQDQVRDTANAELQRLAVEDRETAQRPLGNVGGQPEEQHDCRLTSSLSGVTTPSQASVITEETTPSQVSDNGEGRSRQGGNVARGTT